jgi:hypothetical protein
MSLKITSLFVAMVTMTLTAFSATPASLEIVSAAEAVYSVNYKTAEVGKVKVSIFNSENKMIFTEVLNNIGSFKRPYNFSELTEGEYTIVVADKNGNQVEKVNYLKNKITSLVTVAQVANADHKYKLNVANNGTEVVSVRIYDNVKGLLYEESMEVTGNHSMIYNLSKVKPAPNAIIIFEVVTSNGKTETVMF